MDFQKYITQVSVDATTESISTANMTLSIPQHETGMYSYDGNYVLQTGLEVVILMRGYFPMQDYLDSDAAQSLSNAVNTKDSTPVVYPYYQVFRGVVTEVSHEFSGGFYTATMQCGNLLHFWQNLKLSVNGSVFGKRPDASMVKPHMIGHKFTGANPYAIIYTLTKVGFGAAFGVDFQRAQSTSIAAKSETDSNSLFKHAAEWWERRWQEHSGNLRMYGVNGNLFGAATQAYLGEWYDTRNQGISSGSVGVSTGASSEALSKANYFYKTIKSYVDENHSFDFNPNRFISYLQFARETLYDPLMTSAAVYNTDSDDASDFVVENVLAMQAFTLDIGKMGNVNMFETEYMSKMEIAEAVKAVTGFEFYQDVDGDLVFKPPMYNMDTRDDPVYVIKDRDLISLSETESEPEVTMMKGTGSHWANVSGHGIEGWMGVGGVYVDYRLVAKYGYKEETFEANYLSNRQAIFLSAINRLDVANAGIKSANITIPVRPELRPGYPVYIESEDCFYYAKSISHSFQFGGQCTTSINGVAKRAKWLPPMQPPQDNSLPQTSHVRLDAPGQFPPRPMIGYDQTGSRLIMQGFPNVVMAFDPTKVNFRSLDIEDGDITWSPDQLIRSALAEGWIEYGPAPQWEVTGGADSTGDLEAGTLMLRTTNTDVLSFTATEFKVKFTEVREALIAGETSSAELAESDPLGAAVAMVYEKYVTDIEGGAALQNYLALMTSTKGLFSPGLDIQGNYRYYSSNADAEQDQAPGSIVLDLAQGGDFTNTTVDYTTVIEFDRPTDGWTSSCTRFESDKQNGIQMGTKEVNISRGITIATPSMKEGWRDINLQQNTKKVTCATSDIRFLTFGVQTITQLRPVKRDVPAWNLGTTGWKIPHSIISAIKQNLLNNGFSGSKKATEALAEAKVWDMIKAVWEFANALRPMAGSTMRNTEAGQLGYEGMVGPPEVWSWPGDEDGAILKWDWFGGVAVHLKKGDADCYGEMLVVPGTQYQSGFPAGGLGNLFGPDPTLGAIATPWWPNSSDVQYFGNRAGRLWATFLPCPIDKYTKVDAIEEGEFNDDAGFWGDGVVDGDGGKPPWLPTLGGLTTFLALTGEREVILQGSYMDYAVVNEGGTPAGWEILAQKTAECLYRMAAGIALSFKVSKPDIPYYESSTQLLLAREARAEVIDKLVGDVDFDDTPQPSASAIAVTKKTTTRCTPIFPVSDHAGYEVFGSLPYGRGVSIETYADLISSSQEGNAADSADGFTRAEGSTVNIGDFGSNASSMETTSKFWSRFLLEKFLAGDFERNQNVGKKATNVQVTEGGADNATYAAAALNSLADAERAAILASAGMASIGEFSQSVDEHLEGLAGNASLQAKIRNTPVTSFTRGQAIYNPAAATNLANIGTSSTCTKFFCKGSDGAIFLVSMGKDFVTANEEPVTDFQKAMAEAVSVPWQVTKDALAGKIEEPRVSAVALIDEAIRTGGASLYGDYAANLRGTLEDLEEMDPDAVLDDTLDFPGDLWGGEYESYSDWWDKLTTESVTTSGDTLLFDMMQELSEEGEVSAETSEALADTATTPLNLFAGAAPTETGERDEDRINLGTDPGREGDEED